MRRRSVIRVLLSLLLLMSQQMAMSHAMTHWAGTRDGAPQLHQAGKHQPERALSSSFAQDQTCEQCLAFAQIASAVGMSARSIALDRPSCRTVGASPTHTRCARTPCAFQPRAPPILA